MSNVSHNHLTPEIPSCSLVTKLSQIHRVSPVGEGAKPQKLPALDLRFPKEPHIFFNLLRTFSKNFQNRNLCLEHKEPPHPQDGFNYTRGVHLLA